jgi:hypothetical protein
MLRSLAGVLLIYVLSGLLASTSPIGSGRGVHQFQLVDELLPHIHLVNGQRVEVGASQPDTTSTSNAPAFGAEAGASASLVVGVLLTPAIVPLTVNRVQGERLSAEDAPLPPGRAEAPPVPPPLGASQSH